MKEVLKKIKDCYSQDLEEKKTWYSPAADAYNQVRPGYPKTIIDGVIEITNLSSDSKILELGCGSGNATLGFAPLVCSMVCLEPNQNLYDLLKYNCTHLTRVEIYNTSFEEWELKIGRFDAVLAATSMHWMSPEIAYAKAAKALKEDGFLILLWNILPGFECEAYQVLDEVYQKYIPSLLQYEDRKTQEETLRAFGEIVVNSGHFRDLETGQIVCEATYSSDDYLTLLSTLSPYLKLEPQIRDSLFLGLKEKIENYFGGKMQFKYLSAFQVAKKIG